MDIDATTVRIILVVGVLTFLSILLAASRALAECRNRTAPPRLTKKRSPLTGNEAEFLSRLRKALPEYEVFPQVPFSALVKTSVPESHPQFWQEFDKFSRKTADYVVCERSGLSAKLVIELDDRTHNAEKDRRRDAMLRSAGLDTLRYESRAKPDMARIRKDVSSLIGHSLVAREDVGSLLSPTVRE